MTHIMNISQTLNWLTKTCLVTPLIDNVNVLLQYMFQVIHNHDCKRLNTAVNIDRFTAHSSTS